MKVERLIKILQQFPDHEVETSCYYSEYDHPDMLHINEKGHTRLVLDTQKETAFVPTLYDHSVASNHVIQEKREWELPE